MRQPHTPLPWAVSKDTPGHVKSTSLDNGLCSPDGPQRTPTVARFDVLPDDLMSSEEKLANADFIVRAVNSHYDLLEALKAVVAVADRKTDEFGRAKAAIAKAEEATQ